MLPKDEFCCQLAKSIQAWLWIETETYFLYAAIMDGANSHLVSVTFHNIKSFHSKLELIDSCLALIFAKDSGERKKWKSLQRKAKKLNRKRNEIVHEPVIVGIANGVESIEISPSYFNAQALVKGQTSYEGPVIGPEYKPTLAKILESYKIDLVELRQLETKFKSFAQELQSYREEIGAALTSALESSRNSASETAP